MAKRIEVRMYGTIKRLIYGAMPGSGDAPDIYVGLIVFILVLLILRRGMGDIIGVLTVLVIAVLIEVLDVVLLKQSVRAAGPDILHFTLAPFGLWLAARAQLLRA